MTHLILLAVIHVGIVIADLPMLLDRSEQNRDRWVAAVLLLCSLGMGLLMAAGGRPASVWKLIEAVYSPVGNLLFKSSAG